MAAIHRTEVLRFQRACDEVGAEGGETWWSPIAACTSTSCPGVPGCIPPGCTEWLTRRGLLREADASNEAPSYSAGEAMTLAGMQRETLETAKDTGERAEHELAEAPPRVTDAAVHERFNLRGLEAPF